MDSHRWLDPQPARHRNAGRRRRCPTGRTWSRSSTSRCTKRSRSRASPACRSWCYKKRARRGIPLFGGVTRAYGVDRGRTRAPGAKALAALVAEGRKADGRRALGDHLSRRHARSGRHRAAAPLGLRRPLPRAWPAGAAGRDRQRPAVGPRVRQAARDDHLSSSARPFPPGLGREEVEAPGPRRDQRARTQVAEPGA